MINSSSKYNMAYFNIKQLESKLNRPNLSTALWSIPKSKLQLAFEDIFPNSVGMTFNFLKDIHPEKNISGDVLYRGIFVVICEKTLTESEMQILLSQFLSEHPNIERDLPAEKTTKAEHTSFTETNQNLVESKEDLNVMAQNLEQDNLIFGVLDDINHLDALSKIEGVEIIKNFGDFKKVYFSIPSFRQDEALAHSVTILKQVKCKRSLMDFITE